LLWVDIKAPAQIRTGVGGFKVLSDYHYTTRAEFPKPGLEPGTGHPRGAPSTN
tara:strand:+ start:10709 stop:10867 length:159 start_codon:yes stop_codon:yes gene_type:complete